MATTARKTRVSRNLSNCAQNRRRKNCFNL